MIDASQTFRRNEILIAGANGFLGKVVLGLLLDRFPEFRHLHILVRPRANLTAQERFASEVLSSPALRPIVQKLGQEFVDSKISVLAGDIAEPNCGIQAAAIGKLSGRLGLIINCAGLVEFFPPADDSFRSNVDGVEHIVSLAKATGAKLLHVSTCYVCGQADGLVEETEPILGFYPRRKSPDDSSFDHREEIRYCRERIYRICDSDGRARSKQVLQRLTDLGKQRAEHWGWVNTYTYAKSLGEQIIAADNGLEYAIVRPAIVESALRFPFPGWVEGGRTAAPLVLVAIGGLRHWTVRRDAPLEVVPVDLVASAIVTVSALLLNGRGRSVYQLATAGVNPVLLEPLVRMLHQQSGKPGRVRFLSAEAARARRIRLQRRIDRVQMLIAEARRTAKRTGLPGKRTLAAWGLALRKLGLQALFREQTLELYQPFILDNCFVFEAENIREAYALLSDKDRQLLPWTPEEIDWKQYWIDNQIGGIQKWVQPEAARHWSFQA